MSKKTYVGQGSKTPATSPVKKKYVTKAQTGVLHAGSGGKSRRALGDKKPVSSYAKKVKSQKNRWTSAGPNAYAKTTKPVRGIQLGASNTQSGTASRKSVTSKPRKKKDSPGSKSRAFRKRLGGY